MCNWGPQGGRCGRLLVWVVQHAFPLLTTAPQFPLGTRPCPTDSTPNSGGGHRIQAWVLAVQCSPATVSAPRAEEVPWMPVACSLGEDRGETWKRGTGLSALTGFRSHRLSQARDDLPSPSHERGKNGGLVMPIPTQRITVEAELELSSHTSPHATRGQGCSFSSVSLPWALGARTHTPMGK